MEQGLEGDGILSTFKAFKASTPPFPLELAPAKSQAWVGVDQFKPRGLPLGKGKMFLYCDEPSRIVTSSPHTHSYTQDAAHASVSQLHLCGREIIAFGLNFTIPKMYFRINFGRPLQLPDYW